MSDDQSFRVPTTEELLGLPIDRLPEGIVAVAERLAGARVGLYVVDLEGVALRRLAGGFSMPEEVPVPQMAGPEIPTGHLEELERSFAERGLGRSFHCGCGTERSRCSSWKGLPRSSWRIRRWRRCRTGAVPAVYRSRRSSASPAARECRRRAPAILLPPRIAGFRGAEIAASVLPAYDVGGDWFEHSADHHGAWLAVADAAGKGPRASAVSALTVAALRAARQARRITTRRRHPHGSRDRRLRRTRRCS